MQEPTLVLTRRATKDDSAALLELYKQVSRTVGGIARAQNEISTDFIDSTLSTSLERGLMMVAHAEGDAKHLFGAIHASRPGIKAFSHMLGDLTIVVHPDHQGQGIGRKVFTAFLEEIKESMKGIYRVELIVRESNLRGVLLYETLGFVREGRLENRIQSVTGGYEADIIMAWFNPSHLS
jgi:ribosomal protein S18 acetylase RimI-like enzyme